MGWSSIAGGISFEGGAVKLGINVADHTKLAHLIAHKYKHVAEKLNVDYDDLYQVALIGVWKATQKFDPDKGFTFSTFASSIAINQIKMHLRSQMTGKYQIGNPISEQEGFMDHLSSTKADADFKEVELRLAIQQIAGSKKFKGAVKKRIVDYLLNGDSLNGEALSRAVGCTSSYAYDVLKSLGVRLNMA